MNWLYYLAEANIYLSAFYLAYCLLFTRNTHYQLSRAYLLFSCIVSFLLPVVQISALRPGKTVQPTGLTFVSPTRVSTAKPVSQQMVTVPYHVKAITKSKHSFTLKESLPYLYLAGTFVLSLIFLFKLIALFRLAVRVKSIKHGKYRIVYLPGTDVAFSFFNYLFLGKDAPGADTIITHELVHIRQKHSADIIFLELLKIINWFNPVIYLLQASLKSVHEYIADEQTAANETDILAYASFLLKNAYGAGGSSVTHSFFNYNLLKKRIIMLNQQRSGKLARLKYLVVLPLLAALLCTSTLAFNKSYGWVDLAPAKVKSTEKLSFTNPHLFKRKRLKITQNGVSTITDQFSVDLKNEKIIYTAGNISEADKSLLAKTKNIKVQIVTDSSIYTTNDGRPILPVVNVDGYYPLDHFLHHSINFTSAKGDKGGLVEVEFMLDNNRHITNAKVVKSGGEKLDALALNGFNTYKGVVNDDAGKTLKIGVYFFTDDYSIFKTDSLGKDPEFAGELIITNYKYPTSVTAKGYEYDESGTGFPANGNMNNAKVVIYEKNGESNWYFKNKCTPADLQILKDKYGYTFPSGSSTIIKSIKPDNVKKSRLAYIFDVNSYLTEPYANEFYTAIIDTFQYPKQSPKALTGGVVVLNFNLGTDGVISKVSVAQSAGADFDKAAVQALQSYKTAINDNAGKHSIAILFCVTEKEYRPAVSDKIKRDGYVGELAVCNEKQMFRIINPKK